jgi:hypothetical protein
MSGASKTPANSIQSPQRTRAAAEVRGGNPPAVLTTPRRPDEELYDLDNDPFEIRNLATSAEHQEILRRLRGELERWIESSSDQGRVAEPAALLEDLERKAKESDKK